MPRILLKICLKMEVTHVDYHTEVAIRELVFLIDDIYWPRGRPKSCKGRFDETFCMDCEHLDYCKKRERILEETRRGRESQEVASASTPEGE